MDRESIIKKIQSLLALANSENEHEAKLATQKATELLTKYNLSMQEIESVEREYEVIHYRGGSSRMAAEHNDIFSILQRFFFIKVVRGRKRDHEAGKDYVTWSFFGEMHNVKIAHFVFAFLDKTFHSLYEQYKKAHKTDRNSRKSFYLGLHKGIVEQLDISKKRAEQETGLVVVPDSKINDFIKQTVGKTKMMTIKKSLNVDSNAFNKGVEDGKNVRIAVGLEEKNNGPIKSLGGKL